MSDKERHILRKSFKISDDRADFIEAHKDELEQHNGMPDRPDQQKPKSPVQHVVSDSSQNANRNPKSADDDSSESSGSRWLNIAFSFTNNAHKWTYAIAMLPFIIMMLFGSISLKVFCVLVAIVIVARLIMGGFQCWSIKALMWSVILSVVGSLIIIGISYNAAGKELSWLVMFVPTIAGIIAGVATYKFWNDLLTEIQANQFKEDIENLEIGKLFNGSIFSGITDNLYMAANRGAAMFSGVSFIALEIVFICMSPAITENNKENPTDDTAIVIDASIDWDCHLASAKVIDWELTESDIEGLNVKQLRLVRNSIFARHGKIFKSDKLSAYFGALDWYKPKSENIDNSNLSALDIQNVNFILAHE